MGHLARQLDRPSDIRWLDPASGAIKTIMTGEAKDPHTRVFDGKGHIWFTSQGSNRVGRHHSPHALRPQDPIDVVQHGRQQGRAHRPAADAVSTTLATAVLATTMRQGGVQYAGQKKAGAPVRRADVAQWTIEWIAPSPRGPIVVHVAANAAGGNESADGDFVYTASVESSPPP